MVHRQSLLMFGLAFTLGLLIGLVLNLPHHVTGLHSRHVRDIHSVEPSPIEDGYNRGDDSLHKENLRTLLAQSFPQANDGTESSTMRRVNPEERYLHNDRDNADQKLPNHNQIKARNHNRKQHLDKDTENIEQENQEIELSESERDSFKTKHSMSVELHNQRDSKKAKAVIDIPPSHSQQRKEDKLQKLAPVKTPHPSQHPSGQKGETNLHGQLEHLWETVEGIYWNPQLEHLTPVGFSDTQASQWRHKVDTGKISRLSEGCGRMQNRLVVFDDGSQMCARYRINNDQIQGEVYSYYLAQMLGIDNVPPAILDRPDANTPRWQHVSEGVDSAKWNSRKVLVLTPFVHNLHKAYIPVEFRSEERSLSPETPSLVNKTVDELTELVQWSDLIILDYLTANVDRVVNNMFNLQWSSGMMSAPTHNLEKSGEAGSLIFMDNESGLLHSYRLLDKYSHYHDKMLRSLCIFRRSTAGAIKRFHKTGSLATKMKELLQQKDPLAEKLASLPSSNIQTLNQRLAAVYKQILYCEHKYKPR